MIVHPDDTFKRWDASKQMHVQMPRPHLSPIVMYMYFLTCRKMHFQPHINVHPNLFQILKVIISKVNIFSFPNFTTTTATTTTTTTNNNKHNDLLFRTRNM